MAFSQVTTKLSHMPLFCESILRVTVESVQGNQVYLEWTATLGSFSMVARPLEFLSTFNLRAPPLEVQQKTRIPFPTKQRKGPSSRDEEVTGSLLELWLNHRFSSRVETGMSSLIKESRSYRLSSRGGGLNLKLKRNSRGRATIPKDPKVPVHSSYT